MDPTIPSINLTFLIPPSHSLPDNPEQINLMRRSADPSVPSLVLETVILLARNYFFHNRGDATARLTLSCERGISFDACSDERMIHLFEQMISEMCISIPSEEVQQQEIGHIKQNTNVNEEIRRQAKDQLKTEQMHYFDPIAFAMSTHHTQSLTINLNVHGFDRILHKGPSTTMLRFPHLLLALLEQRERMNAKEARVCLVGPGLYEEEGSPPTSPQFLEIRSLFPNAHFTLLDNDPAVLGNLREQYQRKKSGNYDPLMIRLYTCPNLVSNQGLPFPSKYHPLFQAMKIGFSNHTEQPPRTLEMLDGVGRIQPLTLKINPQKVELREFDIKSTDFQRTEHQNYDIVVATMSIFNVLQEQVAAAPTTNCFHVLEKFLRVLKPGGCLYMDIGVYGILLQTYGEEGVALGKTYLEYRLGHRLAIAHIPFSDFDPRESGRKLGEHALIHSLSIHSAESIENRLPAVSTSAITTFTVLPEKITPSREEIVENTLAMVKLLKRETKSTPKTT